jgi:hypothetical protein
MFGVSFRANGGMRKVKSRRLGALLVGIGVGTMAVVFAFGASSFRAVTSSPRVAEEPIYYVDGARPHVIDPSSSSKGIPDMPEGCVQWSANRPDIHICGDIPAGWTPSPKPYFDKAICDATVNWMKSNPEFSVAKVDSGSCFVAETGDGQLWDVIFPNTDGSGNTHVPFDPTGNYPFAAHL